MDRIQAWAYEFGASGPWLFFVLLLLTLLAIAGISFYLGRRFGWPPGSTPADGKGRVDGKGRAQGDEVDYAAIAEDNLRHGRDLLRLSAKSLLILEQISHDLADLKKAGAMGGTGKAAAGFEENSPPQTLGQQGPPKPPAAPGRALGDIGKKAAGPTGPRISMGLAEELLTCYHAAIDGSKEAAQELLGKSGIQYFRLGNYQQRRSQPSLIPRFEPLNSPGGAHFVGWPQGEQAVLLIPALAAVDKLHVLLNHYGKGYDPWFCGIFRVVEESDRMKVIRPAVMHKGKIIQKGLLHLPFLPG